MASPGWLWLPWTRSRVTKANQNYQGKDLVKNQSTGLESNLGILLENNVSSAIVLMETPMVQPQNIDGQFKIAA